MWRRRRRPGAEPRLDPVRWHRPGRASTARLAAVAALLLTAAAVAWSGSPPGSCGAGTAASPLGPGPSGAGGALRARTGGPGAVAGPVDAAGHGLPADGDGPGPGVAWAGSGQRPGGAPPGAAGMPPGARVAVPPGRVGVPVRPAEPAVLALARPGDRVDLLILAADGSATTIARAAPVLSVVGSDDPAAGGLLVALAPGEARRAVRTPPGGFAVVIRPDVIRPDVIRPDVIRPDG
jgi:hypothetical protein